MITIYLYEILHRFVEMNFQFHFGKLRLALQIISKLFTCKPFVYSLLHLQVQVTNLYMKVSVEAMYDFHIKTMSDSSLSPVVYRRAHALLCCLRTVLSYILFYYVYVCSQFRLVTYVTISTSSIRFNSQLNGSFLT